MAGLELVGFVLLLGAQAGPPHIGPYTPNSQLLKWCKSKKPDEYSSCWSFISGVVEASGMTDAKWPNGAIELPLHVHSHQVAPTVVRYIEALEPEEMSSPAVRSVYRALLAAHPHRPGAVPSGK